MNNVGIKARIEGIVDCYKDRLIAELQSLIQINSTKAEAMKSKPYGEGVDSALCYALSLARNLGFKTKNLDGYVGYAELGDGEEYVAILGHLDTVPAGDGWSTDPFGGSIVDGRIYGRGAIDDKGPILACLFALKAIKESRLDLSHRIRIIFGTDEETDCKDMEYYRIHEKEPLCGFTPDANFPCVYAEKGILNLELVLRYPCGTKIRLEKIQGGTAANCVPNNASAIVVIENEDRYNEQIKNAGMLSDEWVQLIPMGKGRLLVTAQGVSAHGSTPNKGINGINKLIRYLNDNRLVDATLLDAFDFLDRKLCSDTHGNALGIDCYDSHGALSLNVGMIDGKSGRIKICLDIRYPVSISGEEILTSLELVCGAAGFTIENISNEEPLYVSKDDFLIQTLLQAYQDYTHTQATPLAIGGGTYAKCMRRVVGFGPVLPGQVEVEHQADEYIDIEQLLDITKIYADAMCLLAK